MKTVKLDVTTGKKFLDKEGKQPNPDYKEAQIDFNEPESLEEAVSMFGGEEKVLGLAVTQAETDAKNTKRAEMRGKEPGALTLGRALQAAAKGGDETAKALLEKLLGTPIA